MKYNRLDGLELTKLCDALNDKDLLSTESLVDIEYAKKTVTWNLERNEKEDLKQKKKVKYAKKRDRWIKDNDYGYVIELKNNIDDWYCIYYQPCFPGGRVNKNYHGAAGEKFTSVYIKKYLPEDWDRNVLWHGADCLYHKQKHLLMRDVLSDPLSLNNTDKVSEELYREVLQELSDWKLK